MGVRHHLLTTISGWVNLILLLVCLLPVAAAAEPAATGWRIGQQDNGTVRFVLDLSEATPFKVVQRDPQTISLELPALDWRIRAKGPSGGLVRSVQHRRAEGGRNAIDIRLSRAGRPAIPMLLPPSEGQRYRLVLDLMPGAAQSDPLAASGLLGPPTGLGLANPPPPPPPPRGTIQSPFQSPPAPTYSQPTSGPGAPLPEPPAPRPPPAVPRPKVQSESLTPPPPPAAPVPLPTIAAPVGETPPPLPAPVYERRPGYPVRVTLTLPEGKPPSAPPPAEGTEAASGFAPAPTAAPAEAGDTRPLIVLDPGHGGKDPGATSLSGQFEKAIVLEMAQEIRRQLEASGRYRVAMTRSSDVAIRLRDRVQLARTAGAGLFVSIHADALSDPSVRGMSVYIQSDRATDKEAEALAAKENKADLIGGMDLTEADPGLTGILIDLAQRETVSASRVFARVLIRELSRDAPRVNNTLRSAGFAVLTAPDLPAVLLELGYLSNAEDEKLLTDPVHRTKLATGMLRAIDIHFSRRN